MIIRPAQIEELEQLGVIESSAASIFPRGRLPDRHKVTPLPILFEALKTGWLFCALENRQLIGFVSCHRYRASVHMDELSVHPDHGRKGIGSRLVQAVLEKSKAEQLESCTLTTFEDIPWNAPFYRKLGFNISAENCTPSEVLKILAEEKAMGLERRVAMVRTL